jgi:hypothetical protein
MKKLFYYGLLIVIFVLTFNIGSTFAQDGGQPDLKLTELIVQKNTAPGMKILITDVVRNIGTGDAGASINMYYLKSATNPGAPIFLGRRYVSEIDADMANMGTAFLAMPSETKLLNKGWPVPGDYYIISVCDALNYIVESNENNNKMKRPIHIVDLTP